MESSAENLQPDGEAVDQGTAVVEPAQRRRTRPMVYLAAAVLVAVLAGGGYGGWLLWQHHQNDVAAEQALAAAKKYVLTLTNIDAENIDQNFADIADGSTGEFQGMHANSRDKLRKLLVDNKAKARGHVAEAVVKFASRNKVVVVLLVNQAVTNQATPDPRIDRSRIRMTMQKVGGRWLASKVELL
jgi:Mce-associated membrane protein